MSTFRALSVSFAFLFVYACSHPIEIIGEGDVWSTGGRTCTLEDYNDGLDNCSKNYVAGVYQETYYAEPRAGWQFDRWGNYCADAVDNSCSFDIAGSVVRQAWGQDAPPLQAFFTTISRPGTGQFIDSEVIGISYSCSAGYLDPLITKTNGNGEYFCNDSPGGTVTFAIGNIVFPAVVAQNIVTPLDIAGSFDFNDPVVINISRFLQTLDSDGDASNGISIADEVIAEGETAAPLNFAQNPTTFETASAAFVTAAGVAMDPLAPPLILIDTLAAIEHLANELNLEPNIVTFTASTFTDGGGIISDFTCNGSVVLDLDTGASISNVRCPTFTPSPNAGMMGVLIGSDWDRATTTLTGSPISAGFEFYDVGNVEPSSFDNVSVVGEQIVFDTAPSGVTTYDTDYGFPTTWTLIANCPFDEPACIPPVADFDYDLTGTRELSFDASNSFGDIVSYEWDLDGDGDYDDGLGQTAVFVYTSSGEHMVGLKVTDSIGQIDITSQNVTVIDFCIASPTLPIDDGFACTIDYCNENDQVVHWPDSGFCDDGNPATIDACEPEFPGASEDGCVNIIVP